MDCLVPFLARTIACANFICELRSLTLEESCKYRLSCHISKFSTVNTSWTRVHLVTELSTENLQFNYIFLRKKANFIKFYIRLNLLNQAQKNIDQ